jgi:hypothetical protein
MSASALVRGLLSVALFVLSAAIPALAQSTAGGRSARDAFAALEAATGIGRLSMDQVERLVSTTGLKRGERITDTSATAGEWSLVSTDGGVVLLVIVNSAESQYRLSLTPRQPYLRMPDPLMTWVLQRAPSVRLNIAGRDVFEVPISENSLEGRGNSAGIRGRRVQTVDVSVAGEYLGTTITTVWPNK